MYSISFRFGVTFCLLFFTSGGFLCEQAQFINDELSFLAGCFFSLLGWYRAPFYFRELLTIKKIVWQLQMKKDRVFFCSFVGWLVVNAWILAKFFFLALSWTEKLFQVNSGWFLLYQYKMSFLQFSMSHPFDLFLKTLIFVIEHGLISLREFC